MLHTGDRAVKNWTAKVRRRTWLGPRKARFQGGTQPCFECCLRKVIWKLRANSRNKLLKTTSLTLRLNWPG